MATNMTNSSKNELSVSKPSKERQTCCHALPMLAFQMPNIYSAPMRCILFLILSLALSGCASNAPDTMVSFTEEEQQAMFQAYQKNMEQVIAEHPDAVAVYECEQKKIVALNPNTKNFEPLMEVNKIGGEWTPPYFTVLVIPNKPDERCAGKFFDAHPLVKWQRCYAKYILISDGNIYRPRSYSLSEMRSDNRLEFYGSDGLYFHTADFNGHYTAEYRDEGDRFLEIGVCQKK